MSRITLSGTDLDNDIIEISNKLKGSLTLNGGCSFTKFSNEYGKGTITAIKISEEISTLIFDVNFNTDLELVYSNSNKEYIDLFYCLEGSFSHKFDNESYFEKINFRQNTVVKRLKSSKNSISFRQGVPLKMSFISYAISDYKNPEIIKFQNLREMASSSLLELNKSNDYRYLGRICFRTSNFVQDIMPFSFEKASDIFFKEAAILNTIASQLERYEKDVSGEHVNAPIKQYEIDKILAIELFIEKNLAEKLSIENLVNITGLNPAKLQMGFKYLYKTSVNNYITQKRLEKASELITQTDLNVSEVTYQVGFSSRSYFTKIFKERFGMKPSEAQKIN